MFSNNAFQTQISSDHVSLKDMSQICCVWAGLRLFCAPMREFGAGCVDFRSGRVQIWKNHLRHISWLFGFQRCQRVVLDQVGYGQNSCCDGLAVRVMPSFLCVGLGYLREHGPTSWSDGIVSSFINLHVCWLYLRLINYYYYYYYYYCYYYDYYYYILLLLLFVSNNSNNNNNNNKRFYAAFWLFLSVFSPCCTFWLSSASSVHRLHLTLWLACFLCAW